MSSDQKAIAAVPSNEVKMSKSEVGVFAEWYAVQKGISIGFEERMQSWKVLRDKLITAYPTIHIQYNDDASPAEMKIVWPKSWQDVEVDVQIGVVWRAKQSAPNLPDANGRCHLVQCYVYEEATFWQTTYQDTLTPNQNVQYRPAKAFNTKEPAATIKLCGPRPLKIVILAKHPSTNDTITTLHLDPPQ